MDSLIEKIKSSEVFGKIDLYLAEFLLQKSEVKSDIFYILVCLLSYRLTRGDICLEIKKIAGADLNDLLDERLSEEIIEIPDKDKIYDILLKSKVAGLPDSRLPLIVDHDRIYFEKYFFFENELAEMIKKRSLLKKDVNRINLNQDLFEKLFPLGNEINWQAIAALSCIYSDFSVISGGPGTGKTSTVIKILALLLDLNPQLKIALAAPTGKAASRLKESISSQLDSLDIEKRILDAIPREAFTIHRLLGFISNSHEFIHNKNNPLNYDVVVIDESSMTDLALMFRLFSAIKDEAKVILLGDRDQLASVEGGAVFGDICDRGKSHGYSFDFAKIISSHIGKAFSKDLVEEKALPIADSLTILQKSYRFGSNSAIGRLSFAVRTGSTHEIEEIARSCDLEDIEIIRCNHKDIAEVYLKKISRIDRDLLLHEQILSFIKSFTILTATKVGAYGCASMNKLAEEVLSKEKVITPFHKFYEGRPIMVTSNDYNLSLFNGDIGVVLKDEETLKVLFEKTDSSTFKVTPSRLPEHDTAFAMTIHKSQGSEFDEVLIVLPDIENSIMTRELLYTAITRAKEKIIIAAELKTLKDMSQRPMNRMTGLCERLWGLS